MFRRQGFVAGAVFGAVLAVSIGAYAALGGTDGVLIPYKGQLESSGVGTNGAYTFHFDIFNAATDGVACPGVGDVTSTVSAGAFSLVIGPVDPACVTGKAVWLEVSVKGPTDVAFTQLTGRARIYPTLAALTSAAGDFASGALTVLSGGANAIRVQGTNPALTLTNGTSEGLLGLDNSTFLYSFSAVTPGDLVLRASTGSLHFQTGNGATTAAMSIDRSNEVTINNGPTINGDTSVNGNLVANGSLSANGNVTLGAGSAFYAPYGLEPARIISGLVLSDGSRSGGVGFTATRTGVGTYDVNFNTPYGGGAPAVTVNPWNQSGAATCFANIGIIDSNHFSVRFGVVGVGNLDIGFSFIAIGPR